MESTEGAVVVVNIIEILKHFRERETSIGSIVVVESKNITPSLHLRLTALR